jgi:molecular chaperone GrpE
MRFSEDESQGPVIHDRRRIDPLTGQVRDPGRQAGQGQASSSQRRPGKHAAAKPGSSAGSSAGAAAGDPGTAPGGGTPGTAPGGGTPGTAPGGGTPGTSPGGAAEGGAAGAPGGAGRANGEPAAQAGQTAEFQRLSVALAERTADLQRLQAEYANYRKRVERDRLAVREQALANVLTEVLPMLDDIGRAREHGELVGGFKSVADSMESAVAKLGLVSYGEDGDPFDPTLHEALMHSYSAEVTEPTCVRILQPGYKVGNRILRPALVAVAEPGDPEDAGSDHDETGEGDEQGYARDSGYLADADRGEAGTGGEDGRGAGGAD